MERACNKSFQLCYVRTTSAHLKVKQSLLNHGQTLSSETSTSPNRLNSSVFIGNFLFYFDNNDINDINEHNNNNKFTDCVTYFSRSNPMAHNNNNIPIKLLDTMDET